MSDRVTALAAWGQAAVRGNALTCVLLSAGELPAPMQCLAADAGITVMPVSGGYLAGGVAAQRAADDGATVVIVTARASAHAAEALVALLTRANAAQVTQPSTDDAAWMDACSSVRTAMMDARPAMGDTHALLAAIGDDALASSAGAIAAASRRGLGVVLDDAASCAAALAVAREDRSLARAWLAGARTDEPAQPRALEWLELDPVFELGGRYCGFGAITAVGVVRAALTATTSEVGSTGATTH